MKITIEHHGMTAMVDDPSMDDAGWQDVVTDLVIPALVGAGYIIDQCGIEIQYEHEFDRREKAIKKALDDYQDSHSDAAVYAKTCVCHANGAGCKSEKSAHGKAIEELYNNGIHDGAIQ
jgi:hypothetical protein